MSKKSKKLLSMCLAAVMSVSSAGMIAFAEGEATEGTAAETTASEVTNSYDTDKYYARALTLCSALGVITGYDDGSVKPEATVTRAEMAAIVLRLLDTAASSAYNNSFNDVTSEHWAADTVQTAAEMSIINGMGDGSFKPDGEVTYEQAVKMIVCALGYETEAKLSGTYPNGYLNEAKSLDLLKNTNGTVGKALERGEVIKLAYNALLTGYKTLSGTDSNGNPEYSATETLAKAKYDVIDEKGILVATPKITLSSSYDEILDTQIVIDDTIFDTELTGLEDYVGTQVTYYYKEDSKTGDKNIIAVSTSTTKSESVMVDTEYIDEVKGFEKGEGQITMETGHGSKKDCSNAKIMYNGTELTAAKYEAAKELSANSNRFYNRDSEGVAGDRKTFNELIDPDNGTVKLLDSDGDGKYDYVFVEDYETMVVTSATNTSVKGKIYNSSTSMSLDVDTDSNVDLKITTIKGGDEVKPRNLSKDDVVSVLRSLDNQTIKLVVTGESIVGTATSRTTRDDKLIASISGTEYVVDGVAASDLTIGANSTFYFDANGRIGRIESSAGGKLSGSEKYGWIMAAYAENEDTRVNIYTQDGKSEVYDVTSKTSYWAYNATSAVTNAVDKITSMTTNGDFLQTSNGYQIRLCKYKVNSSNELTQLYMAVSSSSVTDDDALIVDTQNLNGKGSSAGLVNNRKIQDGIVGFSVPSDTTDMRSSSNYSAFEVKASNYVSSDGASVDYIVGEFTNSREANVLVRYSAGSNGINAITDYGTASDNPTMTIKSIDVGVDEDDNTIYILTGYRNGETYTTTTNKNTGVYKMNSSSIANNKDYKGDLIWSGQATDSLTDHLSVGDVVGIAGGANASVLIQMVDTKAVGKLAATGSGAQFIGYSRFSETRDGLGIGFVQSIETPDSAYVAFGSADGTKTSSWALSESVSTTVVNLKLNSNGLASEPKVKVSSGDIYDIEAYDEATKSGSFMFFRNFKNDAQREIVIYQISYEGSED